MTRCKLCNSPNRDDIERRIASKELTQVQAAAIIESTPSAISRHMRNCFPRKVAAWVKPAAAKEETINVVNALEDSHKKTLDILEESLAEGDKRTALLALQTEIKQLELTAKLTGQLHDGPSINFLLSPEYVQLKQVLIKALAPYPEAREHAARALLTAGNSDA